MIDEDELGLIGFMFDQQHRKITKSIKIKDCEVEFETIGDDPGHMQSGQYIWPGAEGLAQHLMENWKNGHDLFSKFFPLGDSSSSIVPRNLDVLELGAGCGIAGIFCAQLCGVTSMTFTDYDPGSLDIISRNICRNSSNLSKCSCRTVFLEWGPDAQRYISSAVENTPSKEPKSKAESIDEDSICRPTEEATLFSLIIGSDLIYCSEVIRPLLETVAQLLDHGEKSIFILASSFHIGEESDELFMNEADKHCLVINEVQCLIPGKLSRIQYLKRQSLR